MGVNSGEIVMARRIQNAIVQNEILLTSVTVWEEEMKMEGCTCKYMYKAYNMYAYIYNIYIEMLHANTC
jgi:hypothetical protein